MNLQEARAICYMFDRPIRELKEHGADAYGIPGARFIFRGCWSDVLVWIDGYVINDNDIADYVYMILQDEYGEEKAAEIQSNEKEFDKFCLEINEDIREFVIYEAGQKMSFEKACREYKECY